MNRRLLIVAAVAWALRLAAVIPVHAEGPTSDERDYLRLAARVAGGESFVDGDGEYSKRAPLLPLVLGTVQRIAGDALWPQYLLNAFLGALVVLLVGRLALDIWKNETVAAAAAWGSALYPGLVIYGAVLQTETLYIVLLLLACTLAVRLRDGAGVGTAAVLGLVGGLAALTRAAFLPFFLLLAIPAASGPGGGVRRFREPAIALGVFLLVLAPWTWRNYRVHEAFVPVSSVSGQLFLIGNNPYATGTWSTRPGFDAWYRAEAAKRGVEDPGIRQEVERDRLAARIGTDYVLAHPGEAVRGVVRKAHIFWVYPITHSDPAVPLQGVAVLADALLYLAALFGAVRMTGGRRRLLPVVAAIAFFFGLSLVLHAEARYRLPLVPFFCLFAAWSALPVGDGAVVRDRRRLLWLVTGVAAIAVVYGWTLWLFLSGAFTS